jgi:hypothetical protein
MPFILRLVLLNLALGLAVATAAHDAPLNTDDPAYLKRQYAWFQAQEPRRQQQLRTLHNQFMQLDQDTRNRLTKVMQNYNLWLAKLPAADRERIFAAPTAAARLELIRSMRETDWVETLPKPFREEFAKLDDEARRQKVVEWRSEDAERRDEWALAQRHWAEHPAGKVPPIFAGEDQKLQLDAFVGHLRDNLNEQEKKELDEAKSAAYEFGNWFWYALEVVRLTDRHPILPGSVGPKDFESLPESVKAYLVTNDPQHFRAKGPIQGVPELREMRKAQGRWPEFAIELTRYCQKNNLTLPVQLGDCQETQMPMEVKQFLEKFKPQLRRGGEKGKTDLEALSKAEGSWPAYPRMIVDLARKYNQSISGWTLPGPAQAWDRFRSGKQRPKT